MEENKNKIMLAIIVGAVIVFAAVAFYLVFSKMNEDDKKEKVTNTNSQEEQVVALDVDSELVNQLMNYVSIKEYIFYDTKEVKSENLSISSQYEMAFFELDKEGVSLSCDLDKMSETNQNNDVKVEDCFIFEYEIPEENLEKAMKQVLGEKVALNKSEDSTFFHFSTKWKYKDLSLQKGLSDFQEEKFESFIGSTILYDEEKKAFIGSFETQGGGWGDDNSILSKVESASKEGKKVSIVEKVIFIDLHPSRPAVDGLEPLEEYSIYSDRKYTKEIGKVKVADFESENFSPKELLEKYLDKAMTIVYTFEENENGSYRFVSSKITN